jgi:serine/threonine protein kinase
MQRRQTALPLSRDEFRRNLSDCGLFSGEEVIRLLNTCPGADQAADGVALGQRLAAAGKLTPYQVEAITDRRFQDLIVGNYEVLARLGSGGMGTVFKARHRRMKRLVALKLLAPEVARQESFVQRFQREVETIAQLSHPNIVMAFDADVAEAGHFLIMEFVNGRDLASEVLENGALSVADAVECTLQAARGLEYAHAQGIVHRDIKPANLLRDASGLVKVADLGLARISNPESTGASGSITQAGGIVGTADFMAPEQAVDSTAIDHRVDIYSLGYTLYYLLVGRPPFVAGSLMALLLKHRDAPIPSLQQARPEVMADLDAVYRRMVAKKPEDRYPTMSEVVQALEAVKGSGTLRTVRPSSQATQRAAEALLSGVTVAADSPEHLEDKDTSPDTPRPSEVRRVADLVVVLVEPSRAQAAIVRRYLQQLGIEKIHAIGSGQQAIALAKEHHAHVLISSMHLSDMTGTQLAEALHADPDCAAVGFVLSSSEADLSEAGAVLSAPRTVLLPKPFDLRKLALALARATGRASEDVLPPS